MNLSQRDRNALFRGGGLLAVLLFVYFILLPWIASWRSARQRIASARTEITTLRAEAQKLAGQRSRLREALGPAVDGDLPDLAQARLRAVETVERIMSRGRAKIDTVQPESARPLRNEAEGVALLTLRVEGRGKVEQLTGLLSALREADRLILVDRLDVSTGGSGGRRGRGGGGLSFTLTLSTPARAGASS